MSQIFFWTIITLTFLTLTSCNQIENQNGGDNYYNIQEMLKINKYPLLRLCGQEIIEALSMVCNESGYNKRSSGFYNQLVKNDLTQGICNRKYENLTQSLIYFQNHLIMF